MLNTAFTNRCMDASILKDLKTLEQWLQGLTGDGFTPSKAETNELTAALKQDLPKAPSFWDQLFEIGEKVLPTILSLL